MDRNYDITDPKAIERYAQRLVGHTMAEFLPPQDLNAANKGRFGNLVEEYLGIPANSVPGADFRTIGGADVEVKSLPLKMTREGLRVKERLVFNIIDYMGICRETWETSSFLAKNKLILLVTYIYEPEKSPYEYCINSARLLDLTNMPQDDWRIMKADWEKIVSAIRSGHAESLSEGSTFYLGACTKGSTAESSLRHQPYSPIDAKQRAFSWKSSYLNHVIDGLCSTRFRGRSVFGGYPGTLCFEQFVVSHFASYISKRAEQIAVELGKTYDTKAKHYLALIAKAILGAAEDEEIDEFFKADVKIKTICLETNGQLEESISFPCIRYKEILDECWEDSTLRSMLDRKFLFVIFQKSNTGARILQRVMFWNMPVEILDSDVRSVWEQTVAMIRAERFDALPGKSWNPVCHVRPHGTSALDTAETASGRRVGKKCFWLSNGFILSQIR